jgi:uncharacterized protein (DUF2147 family)
MRIYLAWLLISLPSVVLAGATPPPVSPSPAAKAAHRHSHASPVATKPMSKQALQKKKQLVGKWKQVDGPDQVEFSNDGTFRAENSEATLLGRYKVREDGAVEIDLGLGRLTHGAMLRRVKVKGNEMTLEDSAGKNRIRYRRTK